MSNLFSPSVFNGVQMEPEIEPMKTGKAGGWGIFQYHWVSMPVNDSNKYLDTVTPAIEWCNDCFGKPGNRWFEKKKKFYFKNEKDMTLFILKFCS
jgi:hypothetical protein